MAYDENAFRDNDRKAFVEETDADNGVARAVKLYPSQEFLDQLLALICVGTPKQFIIDAITSGNKYEHTFTDGTKRFTLMTSVEKSSIIKYNWSETDFDAGKFHTIEQGGEYDIFCTNLQTQTIYFTCERNNVDIEIEEWK